MATTQYIGPQGGSQVVLSDGTTLTFDAVADGELLVRSGSTLVGASAGSITLDGPLLIESQTTSRTLTLGYDDATTDTVIDVLRVRRSTTGTAAAGIGAAIAFSAEVSPPSTIPGAGRIGVLWYDLTGNRNSRMFFDVSIENTDLSNAAQLDGNGFCAQTGSDQSGGIDRTFAIPAAALTGRKWDTGATSTGDVLVLDSRTSGTAGVDFGGGVLFTGEDASGNAENLGRLAFVWTDATSGTETSAASLQLRSSGAALGEFFRLSTSGLGVSDGTAAISAHRGHFIGAANSTQSIVVETTSSGASASAQIQIATPTAGLQTLVYGASVAGDAITGVARANLAHFSLGSGGSGFLFNTADASPLYFATQGTLRVTISTTALTSTLKLVGPAGSVTAPGLSLSEINTGLYYNANYSISIASNQIASWTFGDATLAETAGAAGVHTSNLPITINPIVATSGTAKTFTITAVANTGQTASTEAIDVNINLARTVQFATGALTTQRAFVVQAPTYAFVGASTLTDAATVAITGAPVAGANATITNAYALWVQGGKSQFDNVVGITNTTTALDLLKIVGTSSITSFRIISTAPGSTATSMLLRVNNNGGDNEVAVTLGAVDSGGAGYRALRVPN